MLFNKCIVSILYDNELYKLMSNKSSSNVYYCNLEKLQKLFTPTELSKGIAGNPSVTRFFFVK